MNIGKNKTYNLMNIRAWKFQMLVNDVQASRGRIYKDIYEFVPISWFHRGNIIIILL